MVGMAASVQIALSRKISAIRILFYVSAAMKKEVLLRLLNGVSMTHNFRTEVGY